MKRRNKLPGLQYKEDAQSAYKAMRLALLLLKIEIVYLDVWLVSL